MERLLQSVWPFLRDGSFSGIRISTRPDAVGEERLQICKRYGVTSVELGVQSMSDEVLRQNGRGHTAAQVREAAARIRAFGFSLGLQMMTGLYGDTPAGARQTAEAMIALRPDTVRIYPTLVMRGTRLAEWYAAGRYHPQSLPEAVELCAELLEQFARAGISVIRVGLHDSPELRQNLLAGPYHPAFRELCESRLLRDKIETLLCGQEKGIVKVDVNPRDRSRAAGQRGENRTYFEMLGYSVRFRENRAVRMGECAIHQQESR